MEISFMIKIGLVIILMCEVNTTYEELFDGTPTTINKTKCAQQCHCSPTTMLCPGANITEVLDFGIDLQVMYVDFSNMTLDIIPIEMTFLTNCKKLNLSSNNIQTIDKISLQNFWNLEELILSNNSIMDIDAINLNALFKIDKYIKILNLSNNNFMDLGRDIDTVLYSESLEVLDVSNCRINSLVGPMVLRGLKKLTYLNLENNPLTRFDGLLSSTLTVLNIRGCLLNYLNEGTLRGFKNLEVMDASLNDQLYITNAIHSTSLKKLDLSQCSVRTPNLLGMPDLRSAFLNCNSIRRLMAYQFVNNTKISYLDLSDNDVESVDPLAFYGMSSLVFLDLSRNMITEIPWDTFMDTLPLLETLRLSHNFISQVDVLKSKTLRQLDLDFCSIHMVQNGAFAGLEALAKLNLSNNPLQILLPGSFNSTHLNVLDLSYCRISHLIPCEFGNSPNLTEIRLTGNRLVTVKNGTFKKCSKLESVYLDDNPWRCDCFSADFGYMTFLVNKTVKHVAAERTPAKTPHWPHCLSPDNVTGMSWPVACANGTAPYGRDNRKNFSMAVGVILILCVSGLMAIFVAVHENMKTRQAMRRRRHLDEYGSTERSGLGAGSDEYFDDYAAAAESVRKLSQLPSYDEAIMLPRPNATAAAAAVAVAHRLKRNSCTQTDEAAVAVDVADCGLSSAAIAAMAGLAVAVDDDDDDDDDDVDGGGGDCDGCDECDDCDDCDVRDDGRGGRGHGRGRGPDRCDGRGDGGRLGGLPPPHGRQRHRRAGHRHRHRHRNAGVQAVGGGGVSGGVGGGGGGGRVSAAVHPVRQPPPPPPPSAQPVVRLHVTQL